MLIPNNAILYEEDNFDIEKRRKSVEDHSQQPIIVHAAIKNKKKYNPEALYKSLNKFLIETAGHEYLFTQDFFCKNQK